MAARKKSIKCATVKHTSCDVSVRPKEFLTQCVHRIAKKIIAVKCPSTGRTPRCIGNKLLLEGKKIFPSMTRNMLNYAVKKLEEDNMKPKLSKATVTFRKQSCISSITSGSNNSNSVAVDELNSSDATTKDPSSVSTDDINNSNSKHDSDSESDCDSKADVSLSSVIETKLNDPKPKAIGRPKGSTDAETRSVLEKIELATSEAADEFEKMEKNKSAKKRLSKGSLDEIIKKSKVKHGLDEDIIILKDTVRQRVKRGSNSGHFGHLSPMAEVEPYLVELVIQLANMRIPVTASQGLELANSLIAGTKVELQVKKWKEHNCHAYKQSIMSQKDNGKLLGLGYWRQFLERNKHLIRTKKACQQQN
jgi:hypothetical protein